jgi:hypothetical protein
MSTKKRQARLAFSDILKNYGIDDLQLEIDLTAVAMKVFEVTEEEELKRVGAAEALARHEKMAEDKVDVSSFPPDVAAVASLVCSLWSLRPPINKKSGEHSSWIVCCRSIIDACGEHEILDVLSAVRDDYETKTEEAFGVPPYTVSGPCSLTKMCRATSGIIRERNKYNESAGDTGSKQSSFSF